MISKQRPQNYWPWWIFNEERSVERGNMALVFSHGKTVSPQAEDEISCQAQQIKESIALKLCQITKSFHVPYHSVPMGSFCLENLVILTLKSAHAWQNVDSLPPGIGSKQDFAL